MKRPSRCLSIWLTLAIWLGACGPATTAHTAIPLATATPTAVSLAPTVTPPPSPAPTSVGAQPVHPITIPPAGTDGYPWWNDTVFYEIFVRSFCDGDGDGIGDFKGLISKLDYLNDGDPDTATDLGVTGLWLMPIHPANTYHGYDVKDYYAVNPQYGTLENFKRLLAEAHHRGMRVIIDWVLNHTSGEHPWFVASQDPKSEYRAWYLWSDTEPVGSGWRPGSAGGYYYAHFDPDMPDLNYTNPSVTAEMEKAAQFWLKEVGVDGLRVDAAKFLIEEGVVTENSDSTHAWYKNFRSFYNDINPQILTVGEIWDGSVNVSKYTQGDQFDMGFDFDLAKAFVLGAGLRNAGQAQEVLARDIRLFRPQQFATFLTNHDQDRAMSAFGDDVEKAKSGAALLLTSPGAPFLYYGEEIGMLGKKPDPDIRVPMQWSADPNGGFTTGTPWHTLNSDYPTKNVSVETANPASLLSFYRTLVQLRNHHAALRVGDTYVVDAGNPKVFAMVRAAKEEVVLVVLNLGKDPVSDYRLKLAAGPLAGQYVAAPILGDGPAANLTANAEGGLDAYQPLPELLPYSRLILQLQPVKQNP